MNEPQTTLRFSLNIQLLEDLHTGTGTGSGAIDSVQILDRRGRPVIRATHLKGLLREAARELESLKLTTTDEIHRLFGGEGMKARGALSLQSLRLQNQKGKRLTWTSTARKEHSRVPLDDTLRTVEHVAADSRFQGILELRDPTLEDLLRRCLKRTLRLGSSRSRGAGLIKTDLQPVKNRQRSVPEPGTQHTHLRLLLRNLDPLCLPTIGFPGNVIPTECYLRGQRLLGALASWAVSRGDDPKLLLDHRSVSVGDALPLPAEITMPENLSEIEQWDVAPIPLSSQTPKPVGQQDLHWPWWAEGQAKDDRLGARNEKDKLHPIKNEDEQDPEKSKRPGDHEFLFRERSGCPWRRYAPEIRLHLRNRVPREREDALVPREREDALFSSEEIAEDTLFLADLVFADRPTAQSFRTLFLPLLQGSAWLSVGRGGRPAEVVACRWLAPQNGAGETTPATSFTLTLQSDLIARTPQLSFYDALDPWMLAELAGIGAPDDQCKFLTVCETVEVRGFNAVSGLPRVGVPALRRGSVIRIDGPGAEGLYRALAALRPLGERTWEGFGRYRLEALLPDREEIMKNPPQAAQQPSPLPEESVLNRARMLAQDLPKPGTDPNNAGPGRSQWQYLRQKALICAGPEELKKLFKELLDHSDTLAGKAWNNVRLNEIQRQAEALPWPQAKLFIDALVRWHWVGKLKTEDRS